MENSVDTIPSKTLVEIMISDKIAEIKNYEKDIPAVIIVMNVQTLSVVYMSERGRKILGVSNQELHEMGAGYFQRFFNEDEAKQYIPFLHDLLHRNDENEIASFFQQVRPNPEQPWTWYVNSVKIIMKDNNRMPLITMITAIPINQNHYMAVKVQRLLDENKFLRRNFKLMKSLTKREIEILRMVAIGLSTEDISDKLFLSKGTVATHRKNIKRKLALKTTLDFTFFAQAFDLI